MRVDAVHACVWQLTADFGSMEKRTTPKASAKVASWAAADGQAPRRARSGHCRRPTAASAGFFQRSRANPRKDQLA